MSLVKFFMFKVLIAMSYPSSGMLIGRKMHKTKLWLEIDYNQKFRGDIYATHGLGPIAQVLNIHRGDKMRPW